jgi:hypothetical protein
MASSQVVLSFVAALLSRTNEHVNLFVGRKRRAVGLIATKTAMGRLSFGECSE